MLHLRGRSEILGTIYVESTLLWRNIILIIFCIFMQVFHSTLTNLVYYLSSTLLNGAQRTPLYDVSFQVLPLLTGALWHVSDIFIYILITTVVLLVLSLLFLRHPTATRTYAIFVVRRFFVTLVILQQLRAVSFLITILPGASEQCNYQPTETQLSSPLSEFLTTPAPPSGNPSTWDPPTTLSQILFRSDSFTGCGDLMFSSHIMVSTLCVLTIRKYFPYPSYLWRVALTLLLVMVPFTLASRKHYTLDVITSLYVTTLMYELGSLKYPDKTEDGDMAEVGIVYGEEEGCGTVRVAERTFPTGEDAPSRTKERDMEMQGIKTNPEDFESNGHENGNGSSTLGFTRNRGYKVVRTRADTREEFESEKCKTNNTM